MQKQHVSTASAKTDCNDLGNDSNEDKNKFGSKNVTAISNIDDPIQMLVLETDEPHPETQDRKGSFGQIFDDLFTEAGSQHEPPLRISTSMHYIVDDPSKGKYGHVPVVSEIPDSTRAILITGSMYDAHGNDSWVIKLLELLKELWIKRPEILFSGVCFGHQILSRLLGAAVEAHPSGKWELAHTEMTLTPIGQRLFRTSDSKLSLHQMHQDQVTSKPSLSTSSLLKEGQNVHVWASTPHTEIQGLYIRDRLFTSQGHLGFDEKMVHRQIDKREESGSIKGEESERAVEARETAHLKHDGIVVAGAILRFFYGDDHDID